MINFDLIHGPKTSSVPRNFPNVDNLIVHPHLLTSPLHCQYPMLHIVSMHQLAHSTNSYSFLVTIITMHFHMHNYQLFCLNMSRTTVYKRYDCTYKHLVLLHQIYRLSHTILLRARQHISGLHCTIIY